MKFLAIFFSIYGVLALSHILIQMFIGHMEHRRQKHKYFAGFHNKYKESVTVVVPVYNEDPEILEACVKSIYEQEYKDLEIIVVDDGSKSARELDQKVYKKYNHGRLRTIMVNKNVGKRSAQKRAFDVAKGEIIVTVDSDTILHSKKAIEKIVRRFKDPEIGAVTGDIRVENKSQNILTKLIGYRYWTAFNQERAAQSFYYVMMCCSGPFSAYRKSIIDKVKRKYVNQNFLGKKCTFGDDRHLTNLVLENGWQVVFDNTAHVYTYVPDTISKYIRQQVRWNKSFYRETLWTLKFSRKHHWYMTYDLIMQLILPFLLLIALGATVYQAIFVNVDVVWQYLLVLVAIALLRAAYGIYRTHDAGFLLFIMYGFMHVFLLIPTRIYALSTINRTKWGTR